MELLKPNNWTIFNSLMFGATELVVEGWKIIKGVEPDKFPQGWQSFSAFEEFLEGSIAAGVGAVLGRGVYRGFCAKNGLEPNSVHEDIAITVGALTGFYSMIALGVVIHESRGVDDVKWGPFK